MCWTWWGFQLYFYLDVLLFISQFFYTKSCIFFTVLTLTIHLIIIILIGFNSSRAVQSSQVTESQTQEETERNRRLITEKATYNMSIKSSFEEIKKGNELAGTGFY